MMPRIKKIHRPEHDDWVWCCYADNGMGWGDTPKSAYDYWVRLPCN